MVASGIAKRYAKDERMETGATAIDRLIGDVFNTLCRESSDGDEAEGLRLADLEAFIKTGGRELDNANVIGALIYLILHRHVQHKVYLQLARCSVWLVRHVMAELHRHL